jgi:hypothetical protein
VSADRGNFVAGRNLRFSLFTFCTMCGCMFEIMLAPCVGFRQNAGMLENAIRIALAEQVAVVLLIHESLRSKV